MPVPAIRLGIDPKDLAVILTPGVGFYAPLHRTDELPFPAGTLITLKLGDTTWTATVEGPDATFSESEEAVAAVIEAEVETALLLYKEPDLPTLPWAIGPVKVNA